MCKYDHFSTEIILNMYIKGIVINEGWLDLFEKKLWIIKMEQREHFFRITT